MTAIVLKADAAEAHLVQQVESLVGGKVVMIERQPRWRTCWFAEVRRDGIISPLYIRGDKGIDAETFPGLEREMTILRLLEAGGIPVPHVYGMAGDPKGIVMDRVTGTRDVSQARDADEARRIGEQCIELLVRMHELDTAPFVAAGIEQPEGADAIAFAYLTPNIELYRRLKTTPQPMVEWALGWARRHVPNNRTRACVVHGDPGQFLFADGRIKCLYDFEATHIGDPMHDLAALRLRHPTEPLGADPNHLVKHYANITGMAIDHQAFSFHSAAFMLAAVMTLAAPMANPGPLDMQYEYVVWDVMCRRAMLSAIAEHVGVPMPRGAPVAVPDGRSGMVWTILRATVARIESTGSNLSENDKASAASLLEWARAEASTAAAHEAADLDRAAAILGLRPNDWRSADAAMEQFVQTASPDHDEALFNYFSRQVEDRFEAALPARGRLEQYALQPYAV